MGIKPKLTKSASARPPWFWTYTFKSKVPLSTADEALRKKKFEKYIELYLNGFSEAVNIKEIKTFHSRYFFSKPKWAKTINHSVFEVEFKVDVKRKHKGIQKRGTGGGNPITPPPPKPAPEM